MDQTSPTTSNSGKLTQFTQSLEISIRLIQRLETVMLEVYRRRTCDGAYLLQQATRTGSPDYYVKMTAYIRIV